MNFIKEYICAFCKTDCNNSGNIIFSFTCKCGKLRHSDNLFYYLIKSSDDKIFICQSEDGKFLEIYSRYSINNGYQHKIVINNIKLKTLSQKDIDNLLIKNTKLVNIK